MGEYAEQMAAHLASGAVRYCETVVHGLENAPAALQQMLRGANIGKQLVKVADDQDVDALD